MGTAEFYGPLEALPSLADCLIVDRPAGDDLELILFVVPAPGVTFDAALEQEIRHTLRTQASPGIARTESCPWRPFPEPVLVNG